ncbi:MAG: efflux RND transporter periplasmic adaptor subunit [Alphaproteobacteria bacterium]|jgi:multidrug efflux pump subunit AcrA (membrane-fusion protein)
MDMDQPTQDALLERLHRLRLAKRNSGWAIELLNLAKELTMARHATVLARADMGWNCLASTDSALDRSNLEALAGRALDGLGIVAERPSNGGGWLFAAALGPVSLTDANQGRAALILEIASEMAIDLILTRERMAFLAALSEAAITEGKIDHWLPLAVASLTLERMREAQDRLSGLHVAAAFIAKSLLPSAERVVICLMKPFLLGVSDQRDIDLKGSIVHRLKTIADEAISRDEPRILQAGTAPSLAEQTYRGEFGQKEILTIPSTNGGIVVTAIFAPGTQIQAETAKRMLPVANALSYFDWSLLRSTKKRNQKLIIAMGLTAVLAIVSVLPRQAVVEAPVTMRSEHVRVVTAPFDGILDSSEVQPGDAVRQDQTILARLATREIELELDAARARAISERRDAAVARAAGQAAQEQISQLSARRAEAQISLLEYRLRLAEMRSPSDGIILSGDLRRNIGQPLARGQTLFEIVPPGNLRAEILVLDEDIKTVAVGQAVIVSVAADPGRHRPATVERIRPMAEVVNGRNVFRVYARFDDRTEGELRGGMEGWAKISVGTTTLLSLITRAPIQWLRRHFFW